VVQQIGAAAVAAVERIQAAAHAAVPAVSAAAGGGVPLPSDPAVPPVVPVVPVAPVVPVVPEVPVPAVPVAAEPLSVLQSAEDPPRRGVSPLDSAPRGQPEPAAASSSTAGSALVPGGSIGPPAASLARAAPATTRSPHARAAAARPIPTPLDVPSSPVPPAPSSAILAAGPLGGHGAGSSANAALTTMTLAGLLLVFLSRVRSIARSLRRAGAVTQPHPPG
jgi:hypothetical protein